MLISEEKFVVSPAREQMSENAVTLIFGAEQDVKLKLRNIRLYNTKGSMHTVEPGFYAVWLQGGTPKSVSFSCPSNYCSVQAVAFIAIDDTNREQYAVSVPIGRQGETDYKPMGYGE